MDRELREQFEAQEEIQRRSVETQQNPYAPQMYEQIQQQQAILVEQTNPKKVIEQVILTLRGKKKLPTGEEINISKFSRPKMNEKGIEKISFILESHINQNIILSHLDETQITKIMNGISDDLVDTLGLNWEEFGIKDKTDLDDINNSVLINIYAALKRAEGQNEKNWISKISIENISSAPRLPKVKSNKWLDKFRF